MEGVTSQLFCVWSIASWNKEVLPDTNADIVLVGDADSYAYLGTMHLARGRAGEPVRLAVWEHLTSSGLEVLRMGMIAAPSDERRLIEIVHAVGQVIEGIRLHLVEPVLVAGNDISWDVFEPYVSEFYQDILE